MNRETNRMMRPSSLAPMRNALKPLKTVASLEASEVSRRAKPAAPAPKTVMQPMPKAAEAALRPLVNATQRPVPIVDLSNPGASYVVVGITIFGKSDVSLLSANGQIVLFDTVAVARQFVPMLGMGRSPVWSEGGEEITFFPLTEKTISRAFILTGYDPYHLPAGMPAGIRSETAGRAWKGHIMWSHAFFDCGQFK